MIDWVFLTLPISQTSISASSLLLTPLLSSSFKDSCDHIGPTWVAQDTVLIVRSVIRKFNHVYTVPPPCTYTSIWLNNWDKNPGGTALKSCLHTSFLELKASWLTHPHCRPKERFYLPRLSHSYWGIKPRGTGSVFQCHRIKTDGYSLMIETMRDWLNRADLSSAVLF